MIPRYSRPEMAAIWAPENRYRIWFEVEALAAEGMARIGAIPEDAARTIREKGAPKLAAMNAADVERIDAIERETRHDVIAFLTWLAEAVGPDSRFVHQGMTSSDVLDTTLSVQLTQAADLLLADIDAVMAALKTRAIEHKHTVTIGRSHGIHAETDDVRAEAGRPLRRVRPQPRASAHGQAGSGRGGHQRRRRHVRAPRSERRGVCGRAAGPAGGTGLDPGDSPRSARRVLLHAGGHRQRHRTAGHRSTASAAVRGAGGGGVLPPRSEGSSAMPHKRNPVLSENLCGLARIVRSAVVPALENVALWHERDISHSSVERAIGPDATVTLDFALMRLAGMMEKLLVYPERMLANLESLGGVVHSGEVLLTLTKAGIMREDAYRIVQGCAMATWTLLGTPQGRSFRTNLEADPEIARMVKPAELDAAMDPALHLRSVDRIFERVFG